MTGGFLGSQHWLAGRLRRPHIAATLAVAAMVGAVAGVLSTGFWNAIAALDAILEFYVAGPVDCLASWPWGFLRIRFLFPAAGALAAALLARFLFATPQRLGVASVMLDARREWGRIPLRYVPATFINGVLTIGSGGSAGREAPVVAMGGGIGAWVARSLSLPPSQRRLFVGCGAAAAIAAAFNAPLAGVFFALEVVLGDFRLATVAPMMLASVAGTAMCRATEGVEEAAHLSVPPYHVVSPFEVVLYAGLGVAAALVGVAFTTLLQRSERFFATSRLPALLRPAVGGLGVGLLGLVHPGVLGNGYAGVLAACSGDLVAGVLLVLLVGKLVATALTLGSGGWGGDFAPALFVGAMTGGLYGALLTALLDDRVASSGAYAMVGMGAVLAAAIRCPITAILLLFELTGSYQVILPIMVAVATATFVASRLSRFGLYHARLFELGGPTVAAGGTHLEEYRVADAMQPVTHVLSEGSGVEEIRRLVATTQQTVFPVLDASGRLKGVVRLADLRAGILETTGGAPIIAADVLRDEVPLLTPEMPLREAAEVLAAAECDELPVVRAADDPRPCGLISQQAVLRIGVVGLPPGEGRSGGLDRDALQWEHRRCRNGD